MDEREKAIRAAFFNWANEQDTSFGDLVEDYGAWLECFTGGFEACEKIHCLSVKSESSGE